MFASFQGQLFSALALDTFKSQYNFFGGFGLLVEDRLGLATVSTLLAVITTFTLGHQASFSGFVLGNFVHHVLLAVLAGAIGLSVFGYVHHFSP